MNKISKATIIAGGLLVMALVAAAIYIPIYISGVKDTAYAKGSYDHAYGAMEDEWDDSRVSVVHASLAVSVCTEHAPSEVLCELLTNSRGRLLDREFIPHMSDGSKDEYARATRRLDSETRQLDAYRQTIARHIALVENNSDSDLWESIGLIAGLVPIAMDALSDAEQAIADGTASSEVIEAKEELEKVLAQYEVEEFPTYWGAEDISQAFDELNSATAALQIAL